MTKKETIYSALGMIEGAVCVSQKNTRDVLMKAIEMIKDAIEEETSCECNHDWEAKRVVECCDVNDYHNTYQCVERVCNLCGATEYRKVEKYEF